MSVDKAILDELRAEAIDSVEDRISSINEALAGNAEFGSDPARILAQVKLDTHSIKSVSGAYEISSLRAIAHRCEDFLFDVQKAEDISLA